MIDIAFTVRELLDMYTNGTYEVRDRIALGLENAIKASTPKNSWGRTSVSMVHYGDDKIAVIKAVRLHTQIGLREAKDFTEGTTVLDVYGADKLAIAVQDAGGKLQINR